MNDELFPQGDVCYLSPRLQWCMEHGLTVWHTELDGFCESPETGEEIKAWSCCTIQELELLDSRNVGTGDTEEDACADWANKHGVKHWNEF